jgi:transcriptional regulator
MCLNSDETFVYRHMMRGKSQKWIAAKMGCTRQWVSLLWQRVKPHTAKRKALKRLTQTPVKPTSQKEVERE